MVSNISDAQDRNIREKISLQKSWELKRLQSRVASLDLRMLRVKVRIALGGEVEDGTELMLFMCFSPGMHVSLSFTLSVHRELN